MEQSEPKSFLYAWLGRNKLGQPKYSVQPDFRGGRNRFKCELRVDGFDHCGLGKCTNKKDAEKFAAVDFIQHLLDTGRLKPNDVPSDVLTCYNSESAKAPNTAAGPPTPNANNWPAPAAPNSGPRELTVDRIGYYGEEQKLAIDQAQAQLVREQEESYRLDSGELHGNWTVENAKSRLHQFLQTTGQKKVDYTFACVGLDHSRTWNATITVYAPKCRRQVKASAQASNKQIATKQCALSIVQQLFHFGEIEAYAGPTTRVRSAEPLPPYTIKLDQEIETKLDSVLSVLGDDWVERARPADLANGGQLVLLNAPAFTDTEADSDTIRCVSWSPVSVNWNCWTGGNLEDGDGWSGVSLAAVNQRLYEEWQQRASTLRPDALRNASEGVLAQAAAAADRRALPVFHKLAEIVDIVERNRVVLVRGETGCGKTTQIAQYILDKAIATGRGATCNVIVTQPRRISAISVAERVALERGEQLITPMSRFGGPAPATGSVGYAVRFESVLPRPFGAILYCTVGVLLRKMADGLRGVSHVLVDEIHERDVNTDFLMIVLREMVNRYSELRVVLMSATIDTQLLSAYFDNPSVIEIAGRVYPVEEYYLEDCIELTEFMPTEVGSSELTPPKRAKRKRRNEGAAEGASAAGNATRDDDDDDENESAAADDGDVNCNEIIDEQRYGPQTKATLRALSEKDVSFELIAALLRLVKSKEEDGAVLVFLPGWNLISALGKYLSAVGFADPHFRLYALHSQLPKDEQRRVFETVPRGITKVILSTNIAESSITINDVVCVIDSCKNKIKLFTSYNNMTHYATVWSSRASLDQRKGRAGRVRPGTCYRLCSRARYAKLEQHSSAEMLRTPLDSLVLAIKLLQLGSARGVLSRAIEPPTVDHIIDAVHFLQELGALNNQQEQLTPLGGLLARLPVEPRIGKMLICSCFFNLGDAAALFAAALEMPEPFESLGFGPRAATSAKPFDSAYRRSDHFALLNAYSQWNSFSGVSEQSEQNFCLQRMLNRSTLKTLRDAKTQLIDILLSAGFPEECFRVQIYDFRGRPDANLDTLASLLTLGLYPNVCYRKPRQRRAVITMEGRCALIQKTSVLCERVDNTAFSRHKRERLDTPFVVFAEKLRTKTVTCKSLTSVSGLQTLLFGCRKAVWRTETNRLVLDSDGWISIELRAPETAAKLLAIRRHFEMLVEKVADDPVALTVLNDAELQLLAIIQLLSRPHVEQGDAKAENTDSFHARFIDNPVQPKIRPFAPQPMPTPPEPGPTAPQYYRSSSVTRYAAAFAPPRNADELSANNIANDSNHEDSEQFNEEYESDEPVRPKCPRLEDTGQKASHHMFNPQPVNVPVPPNWIRDSAHASESSTSWNSRGRGLGRGDALRRELNFAAQDYERVSTFDRVQPRERLAAPPYHSNQQGYYDDLLGSNHNQWQRPPQSPFAHQQASAPPRGRWSDARGSPRFNPSRPHDPYAQRPHPHPQSSGFSRPYRFTPFANYPPRPTNDWRGAPSGGSRW